MASTRYCRALSVVQMLAVVGAAMLVAVVLATDVNQAVGGRVQTKGGKFLLNGDIYIPQGANYIRLNGSQGPKTHMLPVYHSTFSPRYYNASESAHTMQNIASFGYNTVRVFIDQGSEDRWDGINGNSTSEPLNEQYVANLLDFLGHCRDANIRVMITLNSIPVNTYFQNRLKSDPNASGVSQFFLVDSYIQAKALFAQLLASHIVKAGLADWVFAYSLENEACFSLDDKPFSLTSGKVKLADGKEYNMAVPEERQAAADNNMVLWFDTIRTAIHSVDPHALVTVGMFTFQAVGKTGPNGLNYPTAPDRRYPFRPTALLNHSSADYLDVHVYPLSASSTQWSLESDLASDEWDEVDVSSKPILLGEFGAFTSFFTVEEAVKYFPPFVRATCANKFTGHLFWTWDTWEQPFLINMTYNSNALANVLHISCP